MLRHTTLFLVLVAACGGKTIDGDDGGGEDGGKNQDVIVVDEGPPDVTVLPDSSTVQCNTLDPGTNVVPIDEVAADPPPFASSTTQVIHPGLYDITSMTLYTGPNGSSGTSGTIAGELRANVANSADYVFQIVIAQDKQTPTWTNADANNAGPGALVITPTCPPSGQPTKVLYSVDSSSFTIRVTSSGETIDETFGYLSP